MRPPTFRAASLVDAAAYHLKYSLGKDVLGATEHDRFLAVCLAVRDRLVERWIETQRTYRVSNPKRACYLSVEYLLGRSLLSNLIALGQDERCRSELAAEGLSLDALAELERDPGLGNGGLGRLAACILESLATQALPAVGYGLFYEFGLFRQKIRGGSQVEEPDHWLEGGFPWAIERREYTYEVPFGGHVEADAKDPLRFRWIPSSVVLGTANDVPIAGHGTATVNTLRLWAAHAASEFDLDDFSHGDYAAAVEAKVGAENLTKVLYPDDRVYAGRELRLRQEYLLVSCTLQDILRRHTRDGNALATLPAKVAIQLNDTHPALAVVELMRLLVDRDRLPWDDAWELTRRTISYTNHTLMTEALEQWPVDLFERLLPRHLQLVAEINRRHLDEVERRFPGDLARRRSLSLFDEGAPRRVRMAHLATVGSHAVNGVSALHSRLLVESVLADFAALHPERFTNVTNGVTPRRWLRLANPGLSKLITDRLGSEAWLTDLERLKELEPAADDPTFQEAFRVVKRANKARLADVARAACGSAFDPEALLDVHVKRLHEYKRQLLNVLHIAHRHRKLRDDPRADVLPRTFLFAAKSAPAYWMAKRVIRLIHAVAAALEADPAVAGRLRVVFLPDYRVTLAERIIPAAEISEQISTAGTEASGTGNMKLGLNGAITIGTLDGANVEMREAVGAEHFVSFGLEAGAVAALRASGRNRGWELYQSDPELRRTVDFVFSGIYGDDLDEVRRAILVGADPWMNLADLPAYIAAQDEVERRARDRSGFARSAILNVARLGGFSIDRTVAEYAERIWAIAPVAVSLESKKAHTKIFTRREGP